MGRRHKHKSNRRDVFREDRLLTISYVFRLFPTVKEWIANRHRLNGPAFIGKTTGVEMWQVNGNYHREDGPAVILPDGTEHWYLNDVRHRIGGPAIIYPNGFQEWYEYGEKISRPQEET